MQRFFPRFLRGSFGISAITTIGFVLLLLLPEFAHAAFGTLIPPECNCDQVGGYTGDGGVSTPTSAPAWGCIFATIQNGMTMAVQLAVVLISVFLALAGFTYMTSGSSAEKRQLANKRLVNAVIGLLIVLGAYLIVDSLMKVVYKAGATDGTTQFGPWNAILVSNGPQCLAPTKPPGNLPALTGAIAGSNAGGGDGSAGTAALAASGTGSCSASTVQADAAAGGYPLTNGQANELACIAQYESTCGTLNPPYNLNYSWNKATKNGSASSAAGPFQVLLSTNSVCYDNAPCEQAGGTPGTALNCASGFSNGFPISGSAVVDKCEKAAGNTACSAAAAACQLQHQSFSSMYGADAHAASCQTGN